MLYQSNVKQTFAWYWGAAILLLPLFIWPSNALSLRESKDVFFVFICVLSLAIFGINKAENKKYLAPLIIAMVLSIVTLNSIFHKFCIMQFFYFNVGALALIQISSNITQGDKKIIINAVAITGIIQSFWFIAHFLNYDPYELFLNIWLDSYTKMSLVKGIWVESNGNVPKAIGSLTQQTVSAALIAICSGALFRKRWLIFLPLNGFIIFKTGSAMAFAAFLSTFYFYFGLKFLNKKQFILTSLVITVVFLGIFFSKLTDDGGYVGDNNRKAVWSKVVNWDINNTFLKGKGLGYFAQYFNRSHGKVGENGLVFRQIHNEYLEAYVAFGIWGVLILVYLILLTLVGSNNLLATTVIYSGLVNSFGNFPLHISSIAIIIIACYSINVSDFIQGEKHGNSSKQSRFLSFWKQKSRVL